MLKRNADPIVIPFQFGEGLLPMSDWEMSITWPTVRAIVRNPSQDFGVDASPWGRSAFEMGEMTLTGRYQCCGPKYANWGDCAAGSEIERVRRGANSWQPLVVYVDDSGCGVPCDQTCGCPGPMGCGRWMWTYAQLSNVQIQSSIDVYLRQTEAQKFQFLLREPFREMTYHYWRYGSAAPRSVSMTPRQVEEITLLSRNEFFAPCKSPGCCVTETRWWFKEWQDYFCDDWEALHPADKFSRYGWPGTVYEVSGKVNLFVAGTADPSVYFKGIHSDNITVINDVYGTRTYYLRSGYVVDPKQPVVYSRAGRVTTDLAQIRLAPGNNQIETGGLVEIGVIPRWL